MDECIDILPKSWKRDSLTAEEEKWSSTKTSKVLEISSLGVIEIKPEIINIDKLKKQGSVDNCNVGSDIDVKWRMNQKFI